MYALCGLEVPILYIGLLSFIIHPFVRLNVLEWVQCFLQSAQLLNCALAIGCQLWPCCYCWILVHRILFVSVLLRLTEFLILRLDSFLSPQHWGALVYHQHSVGLLVASRFYVTLVNNCHCLPNTDNKGIDVFPYIEIYFSPTRHLILPYFSLLMTRIIY